MTKKSFLVGFYKIAAVRLPNWLHTSHLHMDGRKSMPGFSKQKTGLRAMMKRRGAKS